MQQQQKQHDSFIFSVQLLGKFLRKSFWNTVDWPLHSERGREMERKGFTIWWHWSKKLDQVNRLVKMLFL